MVSMRGQSQTHCHRMFGKVSEIRSPLTLVLFMNLELHSLSLTSHDGRSRYVATSSFVYFPCPQHGAS